MNGLDPYRGATDGLPNLLSRTRFLDASTKKSVAKFFFQANSIDSRPLRAFNTYLQVRGLAIPFARRYRAAQNT